MKVADTVEILAADTRGIYCPQHVCEACNITPLPDAGEQAAASLSEAIDICKQGPHDNEDYWEAWDEIQRNGCIQLDGRTWRIYQDGDVFAVEMNEEGDRWMEENTGN